MKTIKQIEVKIAKISKDVDNKMGEKAFANLSGKSDALFWARGSTEEEIRKYIKEIKQDMKYMIEKGVAYWNGKIQILQWVLGSKEAN